MLAKVHSAALHGIDGALISVEVDIAPGMPALSTVGLPDAAVREARDRVISAIRNSGLDFPARRITINLAPADIKKEGASYDLPMAIGILAAADVLKTQHLAQWCLFGELALDGKLRPVKGVLPMALAARRRKLKGLILPRANAEEASVVEGLQIFAAQTLREVVDALGQTVLAPPPLPPTQITPTPQSAPIHADFADVKGQRFAKRALEIAAAGGHNILMIGPPGSGKTMLAKRIVGILPPLDLDEAIETTKVHSVSGLTGRKRGLVLERPFRNPHHTISDIALIGGGSSPKPGEVSLAHNGVLFLDELPEFHRSVLEVLRQPLENREVVVARAKDTFTFPASFMLVAAMNPCPCGFQNHPARECLCTPYQVQKYLAKISGPLLDRIDIHLEVPALKVEELTQEAPAASVENSDSVRRRVLAARAKQHARFKVSGNAAATSVSVFCNAQMQPAQTKLHCALDDAGKNLLQNAITRLSLSARAYDRILKVARTIADLAGAERIQTAHIAEAIQYRSLDKSGAN